MGNDAGRGDRSNEPPKLATVRRLHLDDAEGSGATATDEWYETERLTGQITGRTRGGSPIDPPTGGSPIDLPTAQRDTPVVLDWRHATVTPPPTALERLTRTLTHPRKRQRRGTRDVEVAQQPRARRVQEAVPAAVSHVEPPTVAPREDKPAAGEGLATGPRLGLRESADRASHPRKRWHGSRASVGKAIALGRLRTWAIVGAVVLSVAAVAVIGIASTMNSSAGKPRETAVLARTRGVVLDTPAKTVTAAPGLERRVRKDQLAHRTVRAHRHPHRKARDHARSVSSRRSVTSAQSAPPVAAPASTPSTSSYSSSTSPPTYNTQPATSEPAAAVTRSAPLPAGPTGPGSVVGANCNSQCRQ